jgi:hypothetical protein
MTWLHCIQNQVWPEYMNLILLSNFFPVDAISSTKAFILATYSATVDDPFWVAARAILVFITLARDCNAKEVYPFWYHVKNAMYDLAHTLWYGPTLHYIGSMVRVTAGYNKWPTRSRINESRLYRSTSPTMTLTRMTFYLSNTMESWTYCVVLLWV